MKTIGLLAGMSWESSRTYYHHLNTMVKERLGGLNSAHLMMNSVNFAGLEACMREGDWATISATLVGEARKVQQGGAECLLLCTNTMHKVAPDIEKAIDIPFFHIADTLGASLKSQGVETVGLLGTRFTMVEDFYAARLQERFGIKVVSPVEDDISRLDKIIFDELCLGVVKDESRRYYQDAIDRLAERGAGGVALACTEIEMLIGPDDVDLPVFDTTVLHAAYAVEWALAD